MKTLPCDALDDSSQARARGISALQRHALSGEIGWAATAPFTDPDAPQVDPIWREPIEPSAVSAAV